MLMYYFDNPCRELFENRIICVDGDITSKEQVAGFSAYKFSTIVNCAACVKHFAADDVLERINVLGLGRIFDMLGYLCIYDGDYEVTYSEFDGDNLILKLKLPCTLPQEFSNGNTDFYLTGKDEEINLIIKTTDGKLKQYYADYKDYYYLPEEDTVIPKSLGSGIDRKHRKAATRNTCYTWFTCSDAFLSSPVQQKQYLTYTLSCLIGTLERV